MKLNARIRKMLEELNYWHCAEAFEQEGVLADNISISKEPRGRNQPFAFSVVHRCYYPGDEEGSQYWGSTFAIRDQAGNPTEIGRKMGIGTLDKKIPLSSPRGQAIQDFLYRVARIESCRLTNDRAKIEDRTEYARRSRKYQEAA